MCEVVPTRCSPFEFKNACGLGHRSNSSSPSSAGVHLSMDDPDLDDAELWAVIDSAAASRSRNPLSALNRSHKSLVPTISPMGSKPFRNPRHLRTTDEESRVPADGEVVEECWEHRRPQKIARFLESGVVEDRRMVVVRHPLRSPVVAATSPSYRSPEQMKIVTRTAVPVVESPPLEGWKREERDSRDHSLGLGGQFPSVSSFKHSQDAAMAILEKTDYTMIHGTPYIKKSGWRKISFFFNVSFEIRDRSIEFDDDRNVQRAEFVVRAYMQCGRFSDGWGSCERREKKFMKPNHDIPSTAETRAKNKACQDLLGIGEYRAGANNKFL